MNLRTRPGRWLVVAAAVMCAAVLVPAVALASTSGGAADRAGRVATPSCLTRDLTVWVGVPGDGSAGSIAYELEFSNISKLTCMLYAFPGVSAVSSSLVRFGSAAGHETGDPEPVVTLGPGGTAHVLLVSHDVHNYPEATCQPTTAPFLQVYPPPSQHKPIEVPFSVGACARRGPVYLDVSPIEPGVGIPGHSAP
jgi:hypothetical protein